MKVTRKLTNESAFRLFNFRKQAERLLEQFCKESELDLTIEFTDKNDYHVFLMACDIKLKEFGNLPFVPSNLTIESDELFLTDEADGSTSICLEVYSNELASEIDSLVYRCEAEDATPEIDVVPCIQIGTITSGLDYAEDFLDFLDEETDQEMVLVLGPAVFEE